MSKIKVNRFEGSMQKGSACTYGEPEAHMESKRRASRKVVKQERHLRTSATADCKSGNVNATAFEKVHVCCEPKVILFPFPNV